MKQILLIKPWQFTAIWLLVLIPFHPIGEIFQVLAEVLWYLWMISISVLGQKQLKEQGIRTKKTNLIMVMAVLLLVCRVSELLLTELRMNQLGPVPSTLDVIFMILILLLILSTLYIVLFTAKTFTMLKLKRPVLREDIFRNLFCVVPVIGIWMIHNKLKELIVLK